MKRYIGVAALCLALSTVANSISDQASIAVAELAKKIEIRRPSVKPGQSATLLSDGTWLLSGGLDNEGRASAQLVMLDTELKKAEILPAQLAHPRIGHTATVLSDGSVLIIGGSSGSGQPIADIERFNPASREVESIGDVGLQARARHTATLLMDGRVLITGGKDVSSLVHQDALLLDPKTWRVEMLSNSMIRERYGHFAALLPSADVLLWAGADENGEPLQSGEVYDSGTGKFSRLEDVARAKLVERAYQLTVPSVTGTIPKPNASDVRVDSTLSVRFSKPLAPQSLSAATVTLIGPGGAVDMTVIAAEGGLLLFATPKLQLFPGSRYTLFIQGAKDPQGRQLPFTAIDFRTAVLQTSNRPEVSTPLPTPEEMLNDADGELWLPGRRNLSGVWRSGKANEALRHLPKRSVLARTLYGKETKDELPSAPAGVTAIAGQVLKLNATPLANVTLSVGSRSTTTDANGEFLLVDIPSGTQTLVIDGSTADKGKRQFGRYEYRASIEAKKTNALPFVVWMTRLDARNEATIPAPTPSEVVVTNPRIPGLELHLPAQTVVRDAHGDITTHVGITAIPVDQPPFPLPNSYVPVYFTIQPGGAHLQGLNIRAAQGARLIYPNFSNAEPGTRMDFWNYDAREKGWYVYGQGAVSANRTQIVPDEGVVIYEFTGAMIALPSTAPPEGPPPGDDGCDTPPGSGPTSEGDPVDCYTGLFQHERTDLVVNDIIPIEVSRSYRPRDSISRAFGIGTNLSYDIFLIGDTDPWTYQNLVLPDGGRIHYQRTSPGVLATDAAYVSTSAPGEFYGSTIRWNTTTGTGWLLTLKDGRVYTFRDAFQSSSARCSAPLSMRDRYNNTVAFTRDSNCNLTTVTSPNGRRLAFTYDTANRITQVVDDMGRTVTYQYDTSGRLTTVTDPLAKIESYTYDSQHRMLSVTDKRGNVMVTNVYDTNGRVSQQTYADNTTSSFSYTLNASNKVTQMDYTNERGAVKRVLFNTSGYPTSITMALGKPEQQVLTFTRNATTNLVQSQTDAPGHVTNYQYDSKGNTTQVMYLAGTPDATTWNYTYEPTFSRLATVTDPLNHTTTYSYDANGNRTSVTDALGHLRTFTYNFAGQVLTSTGLLGSTQLTTTYGYRGSDLASITDPLNRTTQLFSDPIGRVVGVKDPAGNVTRYVYDKLDRLTQTIDALGHTTVRTYDGNDNLLSFQDGRGNLTQFGYDVRNRLSTKTDPLNKTENYAYDAIGNLSRKTDRKGQITGYSYDFLDRLTGAGFGATGVNPTSYQSTTTYTWDSGNRLTQAIDSVSGTITRDFDALNRLVQEQTPQGQLNYTYYASGLRQTMTVQGQPAVNYAYDDANRLVQISKGSDTVAFAYDTMDRRTTLTLPSGVEVAYGYDDASQLTSLNYQKGSTTIGNLTYAYDLAGRRTSMGGTLAQVILPAAVTSTSYNAANRLTAWGTHTLTYDDNGSLISDVAGATQSYVWDARGRLVQIQNGGAPLASFQYDTFNRRIGKTANGSTTNFLMDGWQTIQELSGGAAVANLLTGLDMDEIFRRTEGATSSDYLTDALGSVLALADGGGAIQTSYVYEPYGNSTAGGATSTNAFQYTGRDNDGTGLYYYRNRYYSPGFGRFVSEDPIGLAGGQNSYGYVNGDPLNAADPLGLRRVGRPVPARQDYQRALTNIRERSQRYENNRPNRNEPRAQSPVRPPTDAQMRESIARLREMLREVEQRRRDDRFGDLTDYLLEVIGDPTIPYIPTPTPLPPMSTGVCRPFDTIHALRAP